MIIFAREQKCINNHFGIGFCAEMVVTNTTKVLEKFFINVFPLNDFFISFLRKGKLTYALIHDMIYRRKLAIQWAPFLCSILRISCGGLGLQVLHSKHNANCLV